LDTSTPAASLPAKPEPVTTPSQVTLAKVDSKSNPHKKGIDKNLEKIKHLTPLSWLKLGVLALLVLALALYLLRNILLGTPINVYAATSGELVQSVVASGRIVSPQRVTVVLQG